MFAIVTSSVNDVTKEFEKFLLLYKPNHNKITQYFDEFCTLIESREYLTATNRKDIDFGDSKFVHWQLKNN